MFARLSAVNSYFFSGYARLPQDVSHQAVHERVGVAVEVDSRGRIIHCSSTLIMDLSRDFLGRLLAGRSVINERDEIETELRLRYRGHSQGALISALRKVYEAVDRSPLATGVASEAAGGERAPGSPRARGAHSPGRLADPAGPRVQSPAEISGSK
jgi:hypothetical protein